MKKIPINCSSGYPKIMYSENTESYYFIIKSSGTDRHLNYEGFRLPNSEYAFTYSQTWAPNLKEIPDKLIMLDMSSKPTVEETEPETE